MCYIWAGKWEAEMAPCKDVPRPDAATEDYFCELLDLAMPWPDGVAAVLAAYLDASKRGGGTLCVAALAFEQAKKATRHWVRLWRDTRCHMTDLNARKGAFRDWSAEKAGTYLVDSVKIINRFASCGVAVSCDVADVDRLAPKTAGPESLALHGGLARAYSLCCHMAMYSLALTVRAGRSAPDIAYFFEKGDKHQGESQRFIAEAASTPVGRAMYGCRSYTTLSKTDSRTFEMVDILAWEWAKHIDRIGDGQSKMRGSLKALLGEGIADQFSFVSPSRHMFHMQGAALERFYARCESVGMFSDNPTPEQLRVLDQILSPSSLAYSP
jgi:hypothetical protein